MKNKLRKNSELKKKKQNISAKIAVEEEAAGKIKNLKGMFSLGDHSLEIAVQKGFEKIGLKVEIGKAGKHDLLIRNKNYFGVIEVKGVTGSASLKHTRQLLQWVMENAPEEDDPEPKGILVINPFKDRPLADRKESAFPENVKQFARGHNLCLITGLQLFCLMEAILNKTITTNAALE